MKHTAILLIVISLFTFSGCKDEDVNPEDKGSLIIEFDNRVGDDDLALNSDYTNTSGETFRVTTLNYYISNIILTRTDGTEFVVPQDSSYFLIREEDEESQEARIDNIPAGDYNKITFTIGVDSLRSTMDISKRTGVLDPASENAMYWTWNSGYIFFKMEGTSPSAPSDMENKFYYHIGGYGGFDEPSLNNIQTATVSMGSARAEVRPNKKPEVHLYADVQAVFKKPTPFKIEEQPMVMFSEFSTTISANYATMFKYNHVHN